MIGSEVTAALTVMRAEAESLMTDACIIDAPNGETTAPNGTVTPTYGDPIYTGKCKVQVRDVDPTNPEAGDRAYTVLRLRVDVPMSATGIPVGARVRLTSAADDPDLVDRAFRVVAPFHGTHKTARRLPVEEMP